MPAGLDLIDAAAVPTAGGTGLTLVELEPLEDKTVLVVGAGGGVGSFATQFAALAGARVIANVRAPDEERVRSYGVAETVDDTTAPLAGAVRRPTPTASTCSSTLPATPGPSPRSPRSSGWEAPRSALATSRTPGRCRRREFAA